jgi:proteasome lid subunit RPN8/RPN11
LSPLCSLLVAARAQLERTIGELHPEECCALVFETQGRLELELVPNVADSLHAADPETYPRTARTGYAIDARIIARAERLGRELRAIIHSHPEGGTALSAEDLRLALAPTRDTPTWPGVAQVVLDAQGGLLQAFAVHHYDETRGGFVAAESWLASDLPDKTRGDPAGPDRGSNKTHIAR